MVAVEKCYVCDKMVFTDNDNIKTHVVYGNRDGYKFIDGLKTAHNACPKREERQFMS